MSSYVLDASALIAVLQMENGYEYVASVLADSCISAVNATEVSTKLLDLGSSEEKVEPLFRELQLSVVPFDGAHAHEAAMLRPITRKAGLSLGDRACLATAQLLGATAVTADKAWAKLRLPVKIKVVR